MTRWPRRIELVQSNTQSFCVTAHIVAVRTSSSAFMCILNYCAWQCPIPSFGKIHAAFVLLFISPCRIWAGPVIRKVKSCKSGNEPLTHSSHAACLAAAPSHFPHFPSSHPKELSSTPRQTNPPLLALNSCRRHTRANRNDSTSAASSLRRQSVLANRVGAGRKLAGFRTNTTEITVLFAHLHPPTLSDTVTLFLRFLLIVTISTLTAVTCLVDLGYTSGKGCCHSFRNRSTSLALIRLSLLQTLHDCNIYDFREVFEVFKEKAQI